MELCDVFSPPPVTRTMRLCYLTTTDLIVRFFLTEHIRRSAEVHDVTVAVNTAESDLLVRAGIDARLVPLAIERDIAPWSDLKALFRLYRLFRRERFDLVHSVAPKAGLLGMLAAWSARVPVRLHTFQGEVWVTSRGPKRLLLRAIDWLTAHLATDLLVVSASERQFLIEQGIIPARKAQVLGQGSISGVDVARFRANAEWRESVRREFEVDRADVLFLYLGRLKRDKGVLDLAHAFSEIYDDVPNAHLVFVGPDEDGLRATIESICQSCHPRLHFEGYTAVPEHYLAATDVLCLPSHREGFGMTIIEAGACGVPAMASRIYGITDALEDGVTGLLHEPRDVAGIARLLRRLATDTEERRLLGERGRVRVLRDFRQEDVIRATQAYYDHILARHARASRTTVHRGGR